MYDRIVISSGHGKKIRGASCSPIPPYLDEVDEARKVVDQVAIDLRNRGVDVTTYHDDVSTTQNENLNRIVDFHNSKSRDLDISVHFNAHQKTTKAMGTEVLYVSQQPLATQLSAAIASCGFINRGPKKRTDLFFLNHTEMPAVLLEVCFVDSEADSKLYTKKFDEICDIIATVLGGDEEGEDNEIEPPEPEEIEPPSQNEIFVTGKASWFGGPDDNGVSPSEGLAFIYSIDMKPELFLPYQPEGTTGLARRLNPFVCYIACRWDYEMTPKTQMLAEIAVVRAHKTGIAIKAIPADWGPHATNTDKVADLSPFLMDALGITTGDIVDVIFPYRGEEA